MITIAVCPKCRFEAYAEQVVDGECDWCRSGWDTSCWPIGEKRAAEVAEQAKEEAVQRGEPSRPRPEQCKRGHTGDFTVRMKNDRPYWTCLACQRLGNKKSRGRAR